ncbi:MAG: DUF3649 domain-containing protein [Pseudomonadota bacterium]|nr:DUF3649 domain-containing protein [Pseudomonadota bacterium]MDQ7959003.1 DUF3649 domain-containing protein [Pseudomonadota bacterium]
MPFAGDAALRYRLAVASRALAAIVGGYGVAALASAVLALWLPGTRASATVWATLAAFVVYVVAVMAVFGTRSAWRAWGGLVAAALVLGALLWLRGGAA